MYEHAASIYNAVNSGAWVSWVEFTLLDDMPREAGNVLVGMLVAWTTSVSPV